MGKKPLSEKQIKSLRKLVDGKPLHELLLNLSVDLMLRGSDLLNLKVADVVSETGIIKTEVKVKQKKTGKTTLSMPLSKNSIESIKKHLMDKPQNEFIFKEAAETTEKSLPASTPPSPLHGSVRGTSEKRFS